MDETFCQPVPSPSDSRRSFTIETIPDDLRDGLLALADSIETETDRAD
jgi:hypothetical protein